MRTLGRSASVAIFAVELLFVLTTPRLYCQVSSAVNDRRQTKAVHPLSIKTSICEALAHPQHFDGRLVEIHAMFSATWEGAWLSDDECKDAGELVPPFQRGLAKPYADVLRAVAKRYSLDDVVRDKSWQAFDSASHRLYVGMSEVLPDGTIKSGDYDYVTADFKGVLAIRRSFRVKDGFGNGWGHLGMSRFLLVLQSLSNVSPHPRSSQPSDEMPPNPKFPPQPEPHVF